MQGNGNQADSNVTPASEFRAMRTQGVVQTLPSGRVVRLRTVTPDRLLRLGSIPDILTPLALNLIYDKGADAEVSRFLEPREQAAEALAMLDSLRVVCTAALVEPRIVDDSQAGEDDEICIEDLTLEERGWIFRLALQPAEFLRSFRYEPPRDVEALPDEQDAERAAEQAAEGA